MSFAMLMIKIVDSGRCQEQVVQGHSAQTKYSLFFLQLALALFVVNHSYMNQYC